MPTRKIYKSKNPKVFAKDKQANTYNKRRANNLNQYRRKKQKFQNSRRPFVEIKSRSHKEFFQALGGSDGMFPEVDGVVNPLTNYSLTKKAAVDPSQPALLSKYFPVWSYMNPIQGVSEKDMLGTTLTAKFLTAKLQFTFPDTNQLTSPRYYILHGWVKIPNNLTQYTTPARSTFTRGNQLDHIYNHIIKDFDETNKEEFLQFKEKTNKDYITLGYKRVRVNRNTNTGLNPTIAGEPQGIVIAGSNPKVNMTLKWPLNNRKLKYIRGSDNSTVVPGGVTHFYLNKDWLPFILYYCPDAGTVPVGTANSPAIAYNDKFWFSDS